MANIPYPHSAPAPRSAGSPMVKAFVFYLLVASVAMAIAIPAAIATFSVQ